jgi:hypothetical protein
VTAKRKTTYLEEIVWYALKESRCPQGHRYKGPGKSLPCRWCRTGQEVLTVLQKMIDESISPEKMFECISSDFRVLDAIPAELPTGKKT